MKPTLDTRTFLAVFWSLATAGILTYVVIKHGDDKGMLNLIVGAVLGLISGILGTYFSMNVSHKEGTTATPGEGTPAVSVDTNTTVTTAVTDAQEAQ
jgi:hypothetical protein